MARRESDREDLIREATALIRRIELQVLGEPAPVVAGIRRDTSVSIYFGPDPVYHVDPQGRLRRAFLDGELYRTQGTTLARLRWHRTETSTQLHRGDLDEGELSRFLDEMRRRCRNLADALQKEQAVVLRQVPESEPIAEELKSWLDRLLDPPEPLAPAIKGKR